MLIRELLAQKDPCVVKCIRPDDTLLKMAQKLREHKIGALLVTDENDKLVGVISERDLVRAVTEFGNELVHRPVSDVMTRSVITCGSEDSVLDILATMNEKTIRHIPVVEGERIRAMISIREFEHACKHLQAQARTDELTGLANRRHFMESLEKEFSRYQRFRTPFSVAMLDIDHFKHVNDSFGHDAGDRVLNALAKVLVRELRTFDGVGRLGGEEFAILFANTEIDKAELVCQRLMAAVRAEEVVTDEGAIRFTVSFGLAEVTANTKDSGSVMKRADKLLYDAKSSGRNRIAVRAAKDQADEIRTNPVLHYRPNLASVLLASAK